MRKKIFINFDIMLNKDNYWQGDNKLFEPLPNSKEFLKKLVKNYEICVFTTRDREKVYKWPIRYFLDDYIHDVTNKKDPAHLYIDDRALKFDGNYRKILEEIENFTSL